MKPEGRTFAIVSRCAVLLLWLGGLASAQSAPSSQEIGEVLQQIKALNDSLRQTRAELEQSRAEIRELQSTVQNLEAKLPGGENSSTEALSATSPATPPTTAGTQESLQILTERVDEHQQTKVESASKFRVKLSGMVLLNAFSNSGTVDSVDLPMVALPRSPPFSGGSIGGSMRQSIIGLTGYGPDLLGARTSADVQMDFFGGIPSGYSGVSSGIMRLRLARMRLDWQNTSLVGGIDTPFFSPESPTSYATVGEPALAAAGNLWAWTPSLRVGHGFESKIATWKIEAGLFDPTGYAGYAPQNRFPTAGESSRQPAYSVRLSGTRGESEKALSVGVAGLYTPLRFYEGQRVHGAGVMADWRIPVTRYFQATGEFFTGKGLEGFGGTPYTQVSGSDSQHYAYVTAPLLAGIGEIGGWSQAKFKVNAKNEFNVAAGYGGFESSAMRRALSSDYYFASLLSRNESILVNYVVRPRSDLLFSAEYRRLRTTAVSGNAADADLVGVAAGFLF
jgi:hypothetical protein